MHDTTNKPSVISISWGGPESSWTQQSMTAFDQAFQAAAAIGITVCVASGDNGSSDGVTDGADHVDFPASSPYALACGGTSLQASGTVDHQRDGLERRRTGRRQRRRREQLLPVAGVAGRAAGDAARVATPPLTMRGVPDVCGDADPDTGYDVRIDGTDTVIGGTSAVAPLWAGLIARINAAKGSAVGYINPTLYASPGALNDITRATTATSRRRQAGTPARASAVRTAAGRRVVPTDWGQRSQKCRSEECCSKECGSLNGCLPRSRCCCRDAATAAHADPVGPGLNFGPKNSKPTPS